jgi:large subunit ribosomal protein L5
MAKDKEQKAPQGKDAKDAKEAKVAKAAKGEDPKAKKKGKDESNVAPIPKDYSPRMLKKYREEIRPALMKKFEYKSTMQVPKLQKIVLNMGVGEAVRDVKVLDQAMEEMATIAGQKPRLNRAKVSVSQFKVRLGMPIGCSVTLRGWRMYDFLDRLINAAIPRVRDFRGLPVNAFDGRGNHNMGVREQLIFTEIDYAKVTTNRGMNITMVTTANTDAECRELLTLFGMPFRKNK